MRIKPLRENAGLSQAELAQKIGLTQQAIAKYEAGLSLPRAENIPQLARVLNCSIQDLFDEGDTQDEPA